MSFKIAMTQRVSERHTDYLPGLLELCYSHLGNACSQSSLLQ